QSKIGEAFSGVSEELGDVGMAVQRAEDKTASLQARAGAVDELLASGALEDVTGTSKDDITAQLDALSSDSDVEMELQRMRESLPARSESEQDKSCEGDDQPSSSASWAKDSSTSPMSIRLCCRSTTTRSRTPSTPATRKPRGPHSARSRTMSRPMAVRSPL